MDGLWTTASNSRIYSPIGKYRLDHAFLAVELLGYLVDHKYVNYLASNLGIQVRKVKTVAIFDIVSVFWNIWLVAQDAAKVRAIAYFQGRWRKRFQQIMGPWNNGNVQAVNDTDPFTQEQLIAINQAAPNSVFSYRDLKNNIYAFSAEALYRNIFDYGSVTNPLTRDEIPLLDRLRLQEGYLKFCHPRNSQLLATGARSMTLRSRSNPTTMQSQSHSQMHLRAPYVQVVDRNDQNSNDQNSRNPSIAFTEVSSVLESRFNIYCQPQWLLALNEVDIMGIFAR
ncbi:MAG: hypothetical protein EB127_18665, partial [Alphaproteobacteria bacterium]|nr:hypothetical protein [Alphaproteobacteria bacterium]